MGNRHRGLGGAQAGRGAHREQRETPCGGPAAKVHGSRTSGDRGQPSPDVHGQDRSPAGPGGLAGRTHALTDVRLGRSPYRVDRVASTSSAWVAGGPATISPERKSGPPSQSVTRPPASSTRSEP